MTNERDAVYDQSEKTNPAVGANNCTAQHSSRVLVEAEAPPRVPRALSRAAQLSLPQPGAKAAPRRVFDYSANHAKTMGMMGVGRGRGRKAEAGF